MTDNVGKCAGPATISQEQARHQQMLAYKNDVNIFTEKQKEKELKKKLEKWEKYNYINVGKTLSSCSNPDKTECKTAQNIETQNNVEKKTVCSKASLDEENEKRYLDEMRRARDKMQEQYNMQKKK